jgi:small subunit ribosomal protein S8
MAMSDPIADFLTRIRNALMAQHRYVDMPWSKMREHITEILKEQGFIENYLVKIDEGKKRGTIRLFLKYSLGRKPVIQKIKRISKPGLRKYVSCDEIPVFYGNLGLAVVSTSRGVLSGNKARELGIGGELLCTVQ